FTVPRDAGRFECEGFLDNGEGAGLFHFIPDPNYRQQMKMLGFEVDADEQFGMALHDVSLEFAKQMKSENLEDLDTGKLMAFRIHGVSPGFIQKLQSLGYSHPEPDQLIAMRIHNVTPEYIAELRSRGMQDLTVDQLVNFRIHGID